MERSFHGKAPGRVERGSALRWLHAVNPISILFCFLGEER